MPRLLVTGGCGFIGANFVHYWLDRHPGDRVVVLDALTYAGNLKSLDAAREQDELRFVHADIRDQDLVAQLLVEESLDTVIHFAAESHVDRSIVRPDAFLEVNVLGTHSLLEAARSAWLSGQRQPRSHRFHHVSTDEVYGDLAPDEPAFSETAAYAPSSPYAASKAAADHLVRAYTRTFGLETSISNCSNNYGPFHYPEKLIPLALVNLLDGKQVPVYGDGSNVRDWLHVADHCRGIERVLERGPVGRTYNLGSGRERTNLEVIRTLCRTVDEAFEADLELRTRFPESWPSRGSSCTEAVTFVKDRPGHDRRYAVDARRAAAELDFRPEIDFDRGLRQTVRWFLDNEAWWRDIMDGSYRQWIESQYPST
ncbi:MAG: dTDP-glucose 4,6-dehydratase [bacterium]|nr:dTDP-glucose 4,6-dehydratase [bacterium]